MPSRVLPYLDLDLRTHDGERTLEELIDDLVLDATSASALPEMQIEKYQDYLNLVCDSRGLSYNSSPGLLVGVRGDGQIAFAQVPDIRDLRTTYQNIERYRQTLQQEYRERRVQKLSETHRQTHRQSQAL